MAKDNVKDVKKEVEEKEKDVKKDERHLQDEQSAVEAEDNIILQETLRGYRVLYLDNENNKTHFITRQFGIKSIRIYDKSIMAISKYGDSLFTRTRNSLMRDKDVVTYQEQMRYLEERGLWSEDHEKNLEKLRVRAASLLDESKKDKKGKKSKSPVDESVELWGKIYSEFSELAAMQVLFFQDTLELQAEEAQRKGWIVSAVTKNEGKDDYDSNNKLWTDIDHLEKNLRKNEMTDLITECANYWEFATEDKSSFFAESPEDLISDSDGEAQTS